MSAQAKGGVRLADLLRRRRTKRSEYAMSVIQLFYVGPDNGIWTRWRTPTWMVR